MPPPKPNKRYPCPTCMAPAGADCKAPQGWSLRTLHSTRTGTRSLFDGGAAAGARARDEGIANAEAGAPTGWSFRAGEAVRYVCQTRSRFTPDDIWETGLEKPPEPRALGPVMLRAAKAGWCERTGELVHSRNPLQHRNMIMTYRSLLHDATLPTTAAAP